MALALQEQLNQLESARQIVLKDPPLYPQIVSGILPIIGAHARLELQRWGAEFLAETFSSPVFASKQKEESAVGVLGTLKDLLEMPKEDAAVVKSVVQTAASIYDLVFHYICGVEEIMSHDAFVTSVANPHDVPIWNQMAWIKSNILKRWDTGPAGVRICCIKFVQKIIQVQTPGVIPDPRRPEHNEISLAIVPRDHPMIPPSKLEPEASGLLDRLLNVFQEEHSDALFITATLNCLGTLLRTRQSISNKIMSVILNFNPLKQANSPMNPKAKVHIKAMDRTTRSLLMNMLRRNENGPFASRIKAHVARFDHQRPEIYDESSRKRGHAAEPTDGLDNAKRRRLGVEIPNREMSTIPPLPPGPASLKQIFTLTTDQDLANFDVMSLPPQLMVNITLPVLARVDHQALIEAVNHVRARFLSLTSPSANSPQIGALGDDEEDYEPDFEPSEDREQIINKADALPPEDSLETPTEVALGPFKLPQPPPMTADETHNVGKGVVAKVFDKMDRLEDASVSKRQKPGLNRLAGSNYDKEAWVTVITRLATRTSAGFDEGIDGEEDSKAIARKGGFEYSLSELIRERLAQHIREDFRSRINIAIAWLNEEWYNDQIQKQAAGKSGEGKAAPQLKQHYERWMLKVLDGIIPYLDAKDKLLIRFLSEIPEVNEKVLERVKGLARDPERVQLAVNTLLYLIMMKPPARNIAIDAVEDLWRNYDDAKGPAAKVLAKWRPQVLPPPAKPSTPLNINGVKSEEAKSPPPSTLAHTTPVGGEQMEHKQGGFPVAAAG